VFSLGATAVADFPVAAQADYDGYVSASKSVTLAATAGVHHGRAGVAVGVAHYEPIDPYDYNRFLTIDAMVDVAATEGVRGFIAVGETDFGTTAYSVSAGVRIWR
jgi:hypothetical protein